MTLNKKLIIVLIFLISFSLSVIGKPEDLLGEVAPDFYLKSLDGSSISLSSFRGYVVLLDFFATWCGPCKSAIPYIKEIHEELRGQKFISISIDLRESRDRVKNFAKQYGMDWIVVIDPDGKVFNKYEVNAIPTFFILDQNGVIKYVKVGFTPKIMNEIKQKIIELLSQTSTGKFDYIVSVNPKNVEINQGEKTTVTITVTRISGIAKPVTLTVIGLPAEASYSLNPSTVIPTGTSKLTISAGSAKGSFTITIKAMYDNIVKETTFTLTIKEKKCIIATATYGSMVSYEVNLLRRFRDNVVLNSYAGRRFYVAFNVFYYSWSPYIAQIIHENPWLKTPFKILLYPLIGSLLISTSLVQPLIYINSELTVYLAGTFISVMIGLIYLKPFYRLFGFKHGKIFGYGVVLSLILCFTAHLLRLDIILTIATSLYIVMLILFSPKPR